MASYVPTLPLIGFLYQHDGNDVLAYSQTKGTSGRVLEEKGRFGKGTESVPQLSTLEARSAPIDDEHDVLEFGGEIAGPGDAVSDVDALGVWTSVGLYNEWEEGNGGRTGKKEGHRSGIGLRWRAREVRKGVEYVKRGRKAYSKQDWVLGLPRLVHPDRSDLLDVELYKAGRAVTFSIPFELRASKAEGTWTHRNHRQEQWHS
jgi:hypothetical protein